jgi:hypothetical protein
MNIGNRKSVGKDDYCRNPLQCKIQENEEMPECVVLKQQYQHTQMASYLHIATPVSSKFKLRPNCLS